MAQNNKQIEILVPKPLSPYIPRSMLEQLQDEMFQTMFWQYSHIVDIYSICYVLPHHLYSRWFSNCFECCCTDNCFMHKLGAKACTVKHKIMKGEL